MHAPKTCTLATHPETFSKQEVLLNESLFHTWKLSHGTLLCLSTSSSQSRRSSTLSLNEKIHHKTNAKSNDITLVFRYQELLPEVLSKYPNLQVSVSEDIAASLNLNRHGPVIVSQIEEESAHVSHVEITFRNAYLTRADMWRLVCDKLAGQPIYKGQKINFLGSIKACVKSIYRQGNKLTAGVFGPSTKPIFRSESARYVIYLQMSKEMWDFEPEGSGEIMFNKVIDGFLPELFERWCNVPARHLISIVLFTRMEYRTQNLPDNNTHTEGSSPNLSYRDFYRVLTSNMESGHHEAVLLQLKTDFKTFLRDISIRPGTNSDAFSLFRDGFFTQGDIPVDVIQGRPAPATRGNILEAINTASSQFSEDYIDRDLLRTGLSIVVVTPGTGVFEVDAGLLNLTTDILVENGVGIDLVCLARMPLHSVPLFKYRKDSSNPKSSQVQTDQIAKWDGSIVSDRGTMGNNPILVIHNEQEPKASIVLDDSTDIWSYAIPHWLDTSFWTGRSISGPHKLTGIRKFVPSNTKPFLTRVKMYEIQMMGIIENEANSVSVPYLETYQEPLSTKDLKTELNALRSQASSASLRNQSQKLDTYGTRLRDPISTSLSPRSLGHIDGAKALSSLVLWMETHDQRIFKIPKVAAVTTGGKRPGHTRSHTVDAGVLSTPDRSENFQKTIGSGISIPKKLDSPSIDSTKPLGITLDRKVSNASLLRPSANLLGSIKGARPSGLGFKGFGSHFTKAAASVELSSETAHRESLLTHIPHSLTRSANSFHGGTTEDREGTWTSSDEKASFSRPTSPPSKPILIKQAGKNKQPLLEQNGSVKSIAGTITSRYGIRLSDEDNLSLINSLHTKPTIMRALAPWFTVLNPSNPDLAEVDPSSRLGRWHHVFPRPLHASTMKWKSLCAPASIPLTSEAFPTAEQLTSEYESCAWSVSASQSTTNSEDQDDLTPAALFREMICARFSNGYQIVIGDHIAKVLGDFRLQELDIFNDEHVFERGSPLYMSRGVQIHRLTLQEDMSIEIKQFTRIKGHGVADEVAKRKYLTYAPYVKTSIDSGYDIRNITFSAARELYNWKRFDNFIACREQEQDHDLPEELRYWRARFVLIPMDSSSAGLKKTSLASSEDNDEEKRLEGIYKLTQLWQKNRFTPVKESHQRVVARASVDTNPLDIIFRTKSPSAVVTSELHDLLIEKGSGLARPRNLLPESELLTRSAIDLKTLAQLLQSEKGVKMQNRQWHFRLHSYTFDAIEFVTWLVDNFKDIDDRETAVEFGGQLMEEGLFSHVDKRHNFRDGNYFYLINPEYRQPRADKSAGWFNINRLASVPSTPIVETRNSPRVQPQGNIEDELSGSGSKTPTDNSHLTKVVLSKKLMYNVDRYKKSYRREIVNLHYDRVSSADDCYHIRINWLNVTPKLIEDAVSNWASAIKRYGLRLVEIPISEASRVNEIHTFRSPYIVKLAKQPPSGVTTLSNDASGFNPDFLSGRFPYHKALLKKFKFVLDLEAADEFPSTVNVFYSWGKPNYQFPQFISRDGLLLAQITQDGNFLLLANRLSNNRRGMQSLTAVKSFSSVPPNNAIHKFTIPTTSTKTPPLRAFSPRQSPFTSPMVTAMQDVPLSLDQKSELITPLKLKDPLETFCQDAEQLEKFYEEVRNNPGISTGPSTPEMGAMIEGRIYLPPVPPLRDIGLGAGKR